MTDLDRIHPLLDGLVDYAGLFPPASLDLPEAVAAYAAHRSGDDAAMLGRFIVPAGRLAELAPLSGAFDAAHPLRLSVLVPGAADGHPESALATALASARSILGTFSGTARIEAVETGMGAVPAGMAARSRLCAAADAVAPLPLFVELPVARRPDEALALLAEFGPARRSGRFGLGAKIRCGGDDASDYPEPGAVAAFLYRCITDGIPFKATAGLHHPVRGIPSPEGPPMHGFLNLFGAAVLGATRGLSEAVLAGIVAETDPAAFSLENGQFAWRDQHAPLPAVQAVRIGLATGFGSCSFDEPADDLRALGWLRSFP